MSSFMIIFIDSYRRVIIKEGSLHQKIDKANEFKNFSTFLRWFLGWLPEDCLKKIGGKSEENFGDNEDEDLNEEGGNGSEEEKMQ